MEPSRSNQPDQVNNRRNLLIKSSPDSRRLKTNNSPSALSQKETLTRSCAKDIFEPRPPHPNKFSSSDPEIKKHAISGAISISPRTSSLISPNMSSPTSPRTSPRASPSISSSTSPRTSSSVSPTNSSSILVPSSDEKETHTKSFKKKFSSSDPETKKHLILDAPSILVTNSEDDSGSASPKTKSRSSGKRSTSLTTVKTFASSIWQLQGQPKEEKTQEGSPRLSPRALKELKIKHVNALKELSCLPKDAKVIESISEHSYQLGKIVLQPNINNDEKFIATYLPMGLTNPQICAEEMWRSMESTKLYDSKSKNPIVDGTKIDHDELKEITNSIHMGKMLNHLFCHVSQSTKVLIPPIEFGSSQTDAGKIGINFAARLKVREGWGLDPSVSKIMFLVLGLGKQEFCWVPATWTIPKEFLTVHGPDEVIDELLITEYGPSIGEQVKPLQYDREISIIMKDGGSLEYVTEQPITFKERSTKKLLGTCRLQTTFVFNKSMDCIFEGQQIKRASFI